MIWLEPKQLKFEPLNGVLRYTLNCLVIHKPNKLGLWTYDAINCIAMRTNELSILLRISIQLHGKCLSQLSCSGNSNRILIYLQILGIDGVFFFFSFFISFMSASEEFADFIFFDASVPLTSIFFGVFYLHLQFIQE